MSDSDKRPFLVAYDYGTGGLWGIMMARSGDEILAIYPELGIASERPHWMSDERYAELLETRYDIDGAPWGLLNALLADRQSP